MDSADAASREHTREHMAALDTLRHAKSAAFWLATIAILAHIAAWYLVRYTTVLETGQVSSAATTTEPTGVTGETAADAGDKARAWELRLDAALGVAGFLGRAAAIVVLGLFVLSLLVSLSARLGGAAGMARASVWSLLAVALLVPWDRLTPDDVNGVPAAFYNLSDLTHGSHDVAAISTPEGRITVDKSDKVAVIRDGLRYAGYPLLVLFVLIAAQTNFSAGYRRIVTAPMARLPMREV